MGKYRSVCFSYCASFKEDAGISVRKEFQGNLAGGKMLEAS